MDIKINDVKELVEQVTVYVEMASVAAAGIKAISELLDKGNDLSQAELTKLLIANRNTIDANRAKIEGMMKDRQV